MADTKITALTAIGANPIIPSTFPIPMVDLTDTSMAASGTTKKVTVNQILQAGGTATLASATITGDLTVDTSTLKVDSANNRVGLGTASPSYILDILGASPRLHIRDNGTGSSLLDIENGAGTFYVGRENSTGSGGLSGVPYAGILYLQGAYPIICGTNFTERYRIASDGVATWSNVGGVAGTAMTLNSTGLGVGLVPANDKLSVSQTIGLVTSTTADVNFRNIGNTTIQRIRYDDSTGTLTIGSALGTAYPVQIGGDTTSRAVTIDAGGNLYLKTTSRLSSGVFSVAYVPGTSQGAVFQPSTDVSSPTPIQFLNSSGSGVGSITTTASATAYNISSDYRLKESVHPLVGGLARISALKPSIYKWKADGSNGEGFLAHELAEVVPLAVTGEKDAVNEDGSIKAQGVDLSKVVPVLVAAIQELTARVQTLETR